MTSLTYLLSDVMTENFDNGFNPDLLWKYSYQKPVRKIPLVNVKHWIYHPCWSTEVIDKGTKTEYFLSIYQVLKQSHKFPDHIERINNADMKFPIIVIQDDYDVYGSILDSNHRFAKAILEKRKTIEVVFIKKSELAKLVNSEK